MRTACAILVFGLIAPLCASDSAFSAKPTATSAGDQVKIAFSLAKATDVEVAVIAGDGKVVRHLAAGMLGGKNSPPEPLRAGLSQQLTWDRTDDFGKKVQSGAFKVRVRAGCGVKFGRFLGDNPYAFGNLDSIAADEDGLIYCLGDDTGGNQHAKNLRVFDGSARYLRSLMPFPADLPHDGMKELASWDERRKTFLPRVQCATNPEFYRGNLKLHLFAASKKNGLWLTDGFTLCHLDPRGAVAGSTFTQPMWSDQGSVPISDMRQSDNGAAFVTASPDGKYIYISGPFSNAARGSNPNYPPGRVYRMKVALGETMQPFVTLPIAGAWEKNVQDPQNFVQPHGPVHQVAVDAKGNVYITDRERQRIAIYNEAGKEIGEIPVEDPHQVVVHPKTEAIYVMEFDGAGYWKFKVAIHKFAKNAGKDAKPLATYSFSQGSPWPTMILAVDKDKTRLWVTNGGLVTLEDAGSQLTPVPNDFGKSEDPAPNSLAMYSRMEVDYQRDEVYVQDGGSQVARIDGKTGKGGMLTKNGAPFSAVDMAVGYDGMLYFQTGTSFKGPMARFTHDLDPAPYSKTGTHVLSPEIYGRMGVGNCQKGMGVGPDGTVYASYMYRWVGYWLGGFSPEGTPMDGKYLKGKGGTPGNPTSAIVGCLPEPSGGVRVDLKGNIYVGARVTPKDFAPPESHANDFNYKSIVGSVVKFPRDGGMFLGLDDSESALAASLKTSELTPFPAAGALFTYPGIAPFSGTGAPQEFHPLCVCRVPRFDVDRYGRLALPNSITNSVLLYDNAGNVLGEFGQYGNFDSLYVNPNIEAGKAGKPTIAVPEIPLGWPTCAGFSEDHLYINDTYNRRVVRADWEWKAEELCPVK